MTTFIAKSTVWGNNFLTVRAGEFQCNSAPFAELRPFSVLKLAFWALHSWLPYYRDKRDPHMDRLFVPKRA